MSTASVFNINISNDISFGIGITEGHVLTIGTNGLGTWTSPSDIGGGSASSGTSINWRGYYDNSGNTTYNIDDAVSYLGSSYICVSATNTTPDPGLSPSYWDTLAQGQPSVEIEYLKSGIANSENTTLTEYTEGLGNAFSGYGAAQPAIGQTILLPNSGTIDNIVTNYVMFVATPTSDTSATGSVFATIYDSPNGNLVAMSDPLVSTCTQSDGSGLSFTSGTFTFVNNPTGLTSGNSYYVEFTAISSEGNTANLFVNTNFSDAYPNGQAYNGAHGSVNPQSGWDLVFEFNYKGNTYGPNKMQFYSPDINNVLDVTNGNQIILNPNNLPNKKYVISMSYYIYNNANELYTYIVKVDGNQYGIDFYLNGDISYKTNIYSDIIKTDSAKTLEFWRTSTNTYRPNTIGSINIHEIR